MGGRVLVRHLNEKGGPGITRAFLEQKVYKILEKKDEDGLVYAVREESDPHARVRVLHRNNLLLCQEFQGFENTNIQAQISGKSARTREAKRKEHLRVSKYLESTDCSSEDEKVYFRPRFTRSQQQSRQKEKHLQSSEDISYDNSIAKSNSTRYKRDHHQQSREENLQSSVDITSDNAIAQSNSQRYSRDHHQPRQSQNSPEQEKKLTIKLKVKIL